MLVTGTEVIDGTVADQNGPWVSAQLDELGIRTEYIVSCRDDRQKIVECLGFLVNSGIDLVVTTGGLGPTADDITAEAVAEFCKLELEYDRQLKDEIVERVRPFVKKANLDLAALEQAAKKQARTPSGASTVTPAGTAPGFMLEHDGCTILVLPGPPRELKTMWKDALRLPEFARIAERATPRETKVVRLFGITESELAETQSALADKLDLSSLEITTCMRQSELEIVARFDPGSSAVAESFMLGVEEKHSRELFSRDGSSIDEQLAALLKGHRLALAESCTAGKVSGRISEIPGASDYLVGAVVAYSNRVKVEQLSVDQRLIDQYGAVSTEVAEAMAEGALGLFDADISLSVTGVAGPDGGTPQKPVGTLFIAVAREGAETVSRHLELPGSRSDVRDRATTVAMHLLRRSLAGES